MRKEKVAVAMSGGVDSGVAAALLVERGYEVMGLHLNFWKEPFGDDRQTRGLQLPPSPSSEAGFLKKVENRCCSLESMEAARKTAAQLGIPFYVKDYAEDFKKIVVDYFLAEYAAGRTPNPCVVCNQFIKFGKLLEYTRGLGCDFLATGHYARIEARSSKLEARNEARGLKLDVSSIQHPASIPASSVKPQPSVYRLLKGVDELKDQSYFLWTLTQDKLAHILFPVGDLTKPEVRKIARVRDLPISERPESFEVCFILDNDYRDFLKRNISEAIRPGEVVNTKGEVIGEHFGLPLYTIGQRKGFEIENRKQKTENRCGVPLYVVGIDVGRNRLVVGRGKESERREFAVGSVNWIAGEKGIKGLRGIKVRVRHQGPLLPAKLKIDNSEGIESKAPNWKLKIALDEPVRGITPGQSAVFYWGEEVLGGGVIED